MSGDLTGPAFTVRVVARCTICGFERGFDIGEGGAITAASRAMGFHHIEAHPEYVARYRAEMGR